MSIILNKEYVEIGNHKIECYTVDGEIIADSKELPAYLKSKGIDIRPAQLQFITTKHRVPKDIYDKYKLEYNDLVSKIPTRYPTNPEVCNPIENTDNLIIRVIIYKVGDSIDHCDYRVDNKVYIRLSNLCKDLHSKGFHFSSMQQLRNCIHRGISNSIKTRYPNLQIITETIEE